MIGMIGMVILTHRILGKNRSNMESDNSVTIQTQRKLHSLMNNPNLQEIIHYFSLSLTDFNFAKSRIPNLIENLSFGLFGIKFENFPIIFGVRLYRDGGSVREVRGDFNLKWRVNR